MRLSLKAERLVNDLRANLNRQDELGRSIIRLRHIDAFRAIQAAKDELAEVLGEMGVLVSQLKREGFDEMVLKGMILEGN